MAELLIEKEVITSEDVEAILGPRQWKSRSDEMIEVNTSAAEEGRLPLTPPTEEDNSIAEGEKPNVTTNE